MEEYQVDRTCTNCGFEVKAPLTKREVAFQLFDTKELFGPTCIVCGGSESTGSFILPTLDKELVSEWARNEDLYFLSQDEELILGNREYFELIIEALDSTQTLLDKKDTLLYALCIIVYDDTVNDKSGWEPESNIKYRAIEALNERKKLLIQTGGYIADYIKEIVYPQLNIWHRTD